jgi:hypothetical protein
MSMEFDELRAIASVHQHFTDGRQIMPKAASVVSRNLYSP